MRPLILAHRGACRVRYENTVEAIRLAAELGADGVEVDVRMTSDGHLVLCHDATLKGSVLSESTLEELRKIDLEGLRIATLEEAMDAARHQLVNLELKRPAKGMLETYAARFTEQVREFEGRLLVTSFYPEILEMVAPQLPRQATIGVLSGVAYDEDGRYAIKQARARAYTVALPQDPAVSKGTIEKAHAEGLQVITWTVDDAARILELESIGIDGIITNDPDLAVRALSKRL